MSNNEESVRLLASIEGEAESSFGNPTSSNELGPLTPTGQDDEVLLINEKKGSKKENKKAEDHEAPDPPGPNPPPKKRGFVAFLDSNYGPMPFKGGIPFKRLPVIIWEQFRDNWRAGLTVCLVSLPLSISLAVAASATPNQGMITAAWAGLFAAIFGGSNYNIVGPTGALSGILSQYAIRYDSSEVLAILSLLAALLLFIVYLFRLDRYMMFIPSSVVHGFTVGVAFIIALNQLSSGLGITGLPKPKEQLYLNIYEVFRRIDKTNPYSAALFLATIIALLLLLRRWPAIPWAVIIASVGILLGFLLKKEYIPSPKGYRMLTLNDKFGDMKPALFTFAHFDPEIFNYLWTSLLVNLIKMTSAAFSIMFVAALETLISAKIAADMTREPFFESWEVLSVTLANLMSGIFGGIPATAALARTSLNVKTGAKSRAAGIISAICIFIISYLALSIFAFLLQPVVAGIVVVVAIRMVEFEPIIQMARWDLGGLFVGLITMLVTFFLDPTEGIIVGSIISLLRTAEWMSKLDGHGSVNINGIDVFVPVTLRDPKTALLDDDEGSEDLDQVLLFNLPGDLTYINAQTWIERVQDLNLKFTAIIVSLRHVGYIDLDGVNALFEIIQTLDKKGSPDKVIVTGIKKNLHHFKLIKRSKWYREKSALGLVFEHPKDALEWLRTQTSNETAERVSKHRLSM